MPCEHAFADLKDVSAGRLSDAQGLGPLLLAAANAAGMHPARAPLVHTAGDGVTAVLACHRGHVAIHTRPDAGVCCVDIVTVGNGRPQRGLDVIMRRLGAREVHPDAQARGPLAQPSNRGHP